VRRLSVAEVLIKNVSFVRARKLLSKAQRFEIPKEEKRGFHFKQYNFEDKLQGKLQCNFQIRTLEKGFEY
jgi:hypothetical protein